MTPPSAQTPPFSPVLLAGLALRPLPAALLRPVFSATMAVMRRRHGDVFERLEPLGETAILIDPADLPFRFLLRPGAVRAGLTLLGEDEDAGAPAAVIRGPLMRLVAMLEGRIDGDAAFFARDLVVEGDMEAVLALRNAVDGGEIDIVADLLSVLGPLRPPAAWALTTLETVLARASRDLESLRAAIVAPVARRCDEQAARLKAVEDGLAAPPRRPRRNQPPRHPPRGQQ